MLEEIDITPKLIKKYSKYGEKPEGKGLLEACSDSIIVFSEQMLGLKLYTWQKIVAIDIMKAVNKPKAIREFVVLTSRQIGKTTFAAIMALWVSVFNKLPTDLSNNSDCGIISATEDQAGLVLKEVYNYILMGDIYCREHYSKEPKDAMDIGIISMLIDEKEDNNKRVMSFHADSKSIDPSTGAENHKYGNFFLKGSKIGTKLKTYPPTGRVLGQKFAWLHEDEAGFAEKFSDIAHKEYLYPTGVARDAIRIYTSTPWQTSGFFYELADPDDNKDVHPYMRYSFTIEAIKIENPKQYATVMKTVEEMRLNGDIDGAERSYYCKFVKGEKSYFDPEKVDESFKDEEVVMLDKYDGECDIGVDYGGQVKSRSAITVTALIEDVVTRIYHKPYEVGKDDSMLDDLENDIMKRFPNWQRIIPDDCPAGDFRTRIMMEKGWNVHPMSFRTWKVKKYGAFRSKLNKGGIKSYKDDDLKIEMKALEFSNAAVQSNITAPRGYRDDLIDSFVMSSFFFLEDVGSVKFWTPSGEYKNDL